MTLTPATALPVALAAGFVLSAVAPLGVIPLLRRAGVIDVPSARSSHSVPTIRGVGLAPLLAMTVGLGVLIVAAGVRPAGAFALIGFSALAYGIVGFVEDARGIPILTRAAVQLGIGGVLGAGVVALTGASPWLAPLIAVGAVGLVNVTNFMDGVDGISSLNAVVVGGSFAVSWQLGLLPGWIGATGLLLAVAFAAFLPWNVIGRCFLGDSGSFLFGGAVVAMIAVAWAEGWPLLPLVAGSAVYVADAAATLVSRIHRGERWYESHRLHVYHRLEDLGMRHLPIAVLVAGASALCAAIGIAATRFDATALGVVAIAAIAAIYLALPRLMERRT
jgi:UDP-GlcNAc:undecaprenyl-phosphate/decaprenyl-phosphate GlcNAc-1-phosphate transferase